ncbi:MAG: hypothetical protein ACTSQY_08750, partial [Candidatus Odinarchaeia archaeon]
MNVAHKSPDSKKNLPKTLIEELMAYIGSPYRTLIFHNAKFDLKFLQRDYGELCGKILDTMILASVQGFTKLKLSDLVYSLMPESASTRLLMQSIIDQYVSTMKPESYAHIPISVLGPYCCQDVANTFDVYEFLIKHID